MKTTAEKCVERAYALGAYNRTGADEFGERLGEKIADSNWGARELSFSPTVEYRFDDNSVAVVGYGEATWRSE